MAAFDDLSAFKIYLVDVGLLLLCAFGWKIRKEISSITHTNYRYILAQDKFSACKAEEWGVAVAASIDDNAADGNLGQRNVRLISVGYTSTALRN